MKATVEINGSQVQLEGDASEIAAVISGLGRSRGGQRPGRPKATAVRAKGRRGIRSKYDDAAKHAIIADAAKVKRGGMDAFLKSKGISYATLGNWRTKFGRKK
jgi:hypothetical protein